MDQSVTGSFWSRMFTSSYTAASIPSHPSVLNRNTVTKFCRLTVCCYFFLQSVISVLVVVYSFLIIFFINKLCINFHDMFYNMNVQVTVIYCLIIYTSFYDIVMILNKALYQRYLPSY